MLISIEVLRAIEYTGNMDKENFRKQFYVTGDYR